MSRSVWIPNDVSKGATSGIRMRRSSTASSVSAFTRYMLAAKAVWERAQPVLVVVGELEVRRPDVLLQLAHARRAWDDDDVRLSYEPCERDPGPRRIHLLSDLAQGVHQGLRVLPRLSAERAPDAPEVPRRRLLILPGEQALGQRAVSDDHPSLLLGPWKKASLRPSVDKAEEHLVREHRAAQCALGGLPGLEGMVAHPDVADQARRHQSPHPRHRGSRRKEWTGPVNLIEVEVLDVQSPSAAASTCGHLERESHWKELRRQEHIVSAAANRFANDAFGTPEAVDLGGVDQVDAELKRASNDGARLPPRIVSAIPPLGRAELPGPEPDRRQPRSTDLDELHSGSSPRARRS